MQEVPCSGQHYRPVAQCCRPWHLLLFQFCSNNFEISSLGTKFHRGIAKDRQHLDIQIIVWHEKVPASHNCDNPGIAQSHHQINLASHNRGIAESRHGTTAASHNGGIAYYGMAQRPHRTTAASQNRGMAQRPHRATAASHITASRNGGIVQKHG